MEVFVKINLLIVVFYVLYVFILEKQKLLHWNRLFLLFGFLASIVLPFLHYTKIIEIQKQKIEYITSNTINKINTPNTLIEDTNFDYFKIFFLYIIVFCVFLVRFFIALFQLLQLYKNGIKTKILNTNIIQHQNIKTPFSFVKIFLPKENLENLDYIIRHENAHCEQKHYIDNIISHLFCAFFWLNPIVWMYKNKIIQNLEYLADDAVLKQICNKKQYQISLLNMLQKNELSQKYTLTNAFTESIILKRIKMMNQKMKPKSQWKFAIIVPFLIVFFIVFQQKIVANIIEPNMSENKFRYIIKNNFTKNEIEKQFDIYNDKYNLDLKLLEINYNKKNIIENIKIAFRKDYFNLSKKNGISGVEINLSSNSLIITPSRYKSYGINEFKEINLKNNTSKSIYTFDITKKTSAKYIESQLRKIEKQFDLKYVLTKISYNAENEINYLNIGKVTNNKTEGFIVEDKKGIGETTIIVYKNEDKQGFNSTIYSELNTNVNSNKTQKNSNVVSVSEVKKKNDNYRVDEYIFDKKSSKAGIEKTLMKMAENFKVKLRLQKIVFNNNKDITYIHIYYQDKLGKINEFKLENKNGIDDVLVNIKRKENSSDVIYTIFAFNPKKQISSKTTINNVRKLTKAEEEAYKKDMAQHEIDMKQHKKDMIQHEKDMRQHEIDMKQHEIDLIQYEKDKKQNKVDVFQHEIDMKQHKKDMIQHEKDIKQHEIDMKLHKKDMIQHEIDMKQYEIEKKKKKS